MRNLRGTESHAQRLTESNQFIPYDTPKASKFMKFQEKGQSEKQAALFKIFIHVVAKDLRPCGPEVPDLRSHRRAAGAPRTPAVPT